MADAGRDKTRGKEREEIAAADKEKKQAGLAVGEMEGPFEFRQQGREKDPGKKVEEKNPA